MAPPSPQSSLRWPPPPASSFTSYFFSIPFSKSKFADPPLCSCSSPSRHPCSPPPQAGCLHQVVTMLRRSANISFRIEYLARKFQCMLADIASATVSMLQRCLFTCRQTEVENASICGENIVEYLILRLDNLASRCHPHPRDLHPSHLGGSSSHVTRTRGPRQGDSIPPPGYYHLVTIVPSEDTKGPTSCPPPSSHPPACGQRRTSTPLTTHNNWRRQVNSKCSIKSRGSFISASQILQGRCHLALNVI